MTKEVNCTYDENIAGWVTVATWEQSAICVTGHICNALTLRCLSECQRISKAVKVHLILMFSLQLLACTVSMPFCTYITHVHFFCLEEEIPAKVEQIFSILNSFILQAVRLNSMVMAMYRALAVCCPYQFQKIMTTKNVIILEIAMLFVVAPTWILFAVMRDSPKVNGTIKATHFSYDRSFILPVVSVYYVVPFVVTTISYVVMNIAILRQADNNEASNNKDQVSLTIGFIILVNLILDGPHVIIHLLEWVELANVISHMIFYLHLVLDPIIFIGMNGNYRKQIHSYVFHSSAGQTSGVSPKILKADDKGTQEESL